MQFDLTIRYTRGSRNVTPDYLSRLFTDVPEQERLKHAPKPIKEEDDFLFAVTVTRSPSSPAVTRGQHGKCGQLYLSSHRFSLISPDQVDEDAAHTIEMFVILLYDRTSTSKDVDKTRCKLFARKNNVQLIPPTVRPSSSIFDEPCTRAGMSGASLCFLHQHCPPRPTGAGSRRATRHTSPTGQHSLRHLRSARSSSPANAGRAARRSASSRRQTWNV